MIGCISIQRHIQNICATPTLRLLAGVNVKTVQYLAGHELARITLDIYAHLTYNRPEEILGTVNMAFSDG